MESTLQNPALAAARTTPKVKTIVYWTVTALFCLEMGFTAYYMLLRLPTRRSHLRFAAPFTISVSSWLDPVYTYAY
jgi:hypothetical protein